MSYVPRSKASLIRLNVWGDYLMNKLPSRTRKCRKRSASEKRRCSFAALAAGDIKDQG